MNKLLCGTEELLDLLKMGAGVLAKPEGRRSGLNNTALGGTQTTGAQAGNPVHSPLRPALPQQAPVAGATKASLVLSNARPIVFSGQDKYGNFLFQKNSAGLGGPRGSLGSLNKISNHVERRGSASMPVHITTAGGQMNVSGHQGSGRPVVLRQDRRVDPTRLHCKPERMATTLVGSRPLITAEGLSQGVVARRRALRRQVQAAAAGVQPLALNKAIFGQSLERHHGAGHAAQLGHDQDVARAAAQDLTSMLVFYFIVARRMLPTDVDGPVILLDDTVRANILFGFHDVSDDQISAALDVAQLLDFVKGNAHGIGHQSWR
jgi:hypothetical protein